MKKLKEKNIYIHISEREIEMKAFTRKAYPPLRDMLRSGVRDAGTGVQGRLGVRV